MIRRRDFISLLGGAAAAWPLAAHAQQRALPVIGFLHAASPNGLTDRLNMFRQGLNESGYIEGENVSVAYRFGEGRNDRLPELAAELVRRRVNVIVAVNSNAVFPAKAATRTIPIVFAVADDPVKLGLVASLARPGGSATGVNFFNGELSAKRLELLYGLVPGAKRVGLLANPHDVTTTESVVRDVEAAAPAMGLQVQVFNAATSGEIDAAFATMARERPDALYVVGGSLFNSRRLQLGMLSARHALPAAFPSRDYPESGGLMSYGANVRDAFRQVGAYAGRILKGAKPADLPVVQSSKIELVINHQTARMLGLTVPDRLLAAADEVIE
jgi:putative tryptophan/tyrosine transport system substrate-binding protein